MHLGAIALLKNNFGLRFNKRWMVRRWSLDMDLWGCIGMLRVLLRLIRLRLRLLNLMAKYPMSSPLLLLNLPASRYS